MSTVSEVTRMAGLMSGLDVESLVKAASASTKNAIDSRKQKLQTLQWKQEAYRDVITALSDFQSKYLNIESKDSIRANAVMKANKAESSNDKLSAIATSSSTLGKYSITSVQQAKAAKLEGSRASSGGVVLDFSAASVQGGKQKAKVTLDGTEREITFDAVEGDYEKTQQNFLNALNDKFKNVSSATFSFDENNFNKLVINNAEGDKVSHIFTVGYSDSVGLKNDASNSISTSMTLGGLDFTQRLGSGPYEFSINGVDFKFTSDTTVKDMMNTINKSEAGVKMSFSSLSQSFTLETSATGAGQELNIKQTSGNLINSLFNISADKLGEAPTLAQGLSDKTVDPSAKFEFTVSASGLGDGDKISINGQELEVVGLGKQGVTEKIEINGKETTAILYQDASGKDIYMYSSNGETHYAKKDGSDYKDVVTVSGDEISDENGATVEGKTTKEYLDELGITKKYKDYSDSDIVSALNDAYKASFPEGKGSFSAGTSSDGTMTVTFTPGAGEEVYASAEGSVTLGSTGMTNVDGQISNYSEAPYPLDKEIGGKFVFIANGTDRIEAGQSGANGKTTIQDLVDTGYFTYDAEKGVLAVNGKNKLQVDIDTNLDDTMVIMDMFGSTDLIGMDHTNELNLRGSNAQMTINGVTLESSSNTFNVEGTSFNIENMDEFTEEDIANGDAEEVTVNVTKDNSKLKETILNFMDAYNDLLQTVYDKLYTSRPKSSDNEYYDPLTEDQEAEMDQDEIDKWNEKAKEGLLYHDTTLTKVFTKLRTAINANVDGFTIQALGIDTEEWSSGSFGKLRLMQDGDAILDSAIERYGDEIAAFFTDAEKGLGSVLNEAVNSAIDKSISTGGYPKGTLTSLAGIANTRSDKKNYLYSQIENMQTIIDKLKEKYESQQERLWKQYTSLETYILQMNSQSSELFGTTTSNQ